MFIFGHWRPPSNNWLVPTLWKNDICAADPTGIFTSFCASWVSVTHSSGKILQRNQIILRKQPEDRLQPTTLTIWKKYGDKIPCSHSICCCRSAVSEVDRKKVKQNRSAKRTTEYDPNSPRGREWKNLLAAYFFCSADSAPINKM